VTGGETEGQPQHRVFLVRHGATEWSEDGRHTGRTDIPLTALGEAQADEVGRLLAGKAFSLVLVSPLQRARETCQRVGYLDQAEVTGDLCEWDYGEAEGVTTVELRRTYPGWTVWDGPIVGGETIEQVASRADSIIARALAAPGDVALFSHGHFLRVLTARWCQLEPTEGKRFPLSTGTYGVLGWEHEYRTVERWNAAAPWR
jgi:broad specificity phosphatase PhoE